MIVWQGLVASYSDANKLCFKLKLTHLNGRVAFREVLSVLLQTKPTADEAPPREEPPPPSLGLPPSAVLPPPKGAKGGAAADLTDTATVFALDTIGKHLKGRQGRREEDAGRDGFEAQRRKRLATITKKKQAHGLPEHLWRGDKSGVFFPVGALKQKWDGLVMLLVLCTRHRHRTDHVWKPHAALTVSGSLSRVAQTP